MVRHSRSSSATIIDIPDRNSDLSSLSLDGEGQAVADLIAQHKLDSIDKCKADDMASNGMPFFLVIFLLILISSAVRTPEPKAYSKEEGHSVKA